MCEGWGRGFMRWDRWVRFREEGEWCFDFVNVSGWDLAGSCGWTTGSIAYCMERIGDDGYDYIYDG